MLERTPSATALPREEWDIATPPQPAARPTWSDQLADKDSSTESAPMVRRAPAGVARRFRSWVALYSLTVSATTEQASAVWGLTNLAPAIAAATIQEDATVGAERVVEQLIRNADAEFLEDGMTAWLGDRLWLLLSQHDTLVVQALTKALLRSDVDAVTASHILRWAGRIHHRWTFGDRLHLLKSALQSQIPILRDGAALGLGEMESRRGIPALRAAIDREPRAGLREDMQRILQHLEELR